MIFMKKLIAIAVVFVLAVGVAFAADIGATVIGKIIPIQGSSEEGSDVTTGGPFRRVRLSASGQNEDGNFGGDVRFETVWDGDGGTWGGTAKGWGWVWWKPLDILKVQFGQNPDGHFGLDGNTRWQFYKVAGDVDVATENWIFSEAFYGGYNGNGLYLTLTPIEPLEINLAVPVSANWGGKAEDVYKKTNAQVTYNIGGIGKVGVSYAGALNKLTWDDEGNLGADASKLWGYFGLSAIENLAIDLGVGYYLPVTEETPAGSKINTTCSKNVALGLGVNFETGALGIKARVQGQFGGNVKVDKDSTPLPTVVTADLLPSFAINDKISALLDTGLNMTKPDGGDAVVGWHIMPYVTVKANFWAPNFYAGFRFESDGVKKARNAAGKLVEDPTGNTIVTWSVPIGIYFEW
jgi:hypothetical protein